MSRGVDLFLAGVLLVGAIGKLRSAQRTEVNALVGLAVGAPLGAAEAIAGVLLILRPALGGVAAGALLGTLFVASLSLALNPTKSGASCGCLPGILDAQVGPTLVVRNAFLVALGITAITTDGAAGAPTETFLAVAGFAGILWLVTLGGEFFAVRHLWRQWAAPHRGPSNLAVVR